jgi:hypothetical protein
MAEFWFYIKLGLHHVLDPGAVDHILFLCALALPFAFANWKKVVILATLFTVAHCFSLALSVYGIAGADAGLIEFLIPVTILITAILNMVNIGKKPVASSWSLQLTATAFFGLIHGFGFSNYFNMLLAGEPQKTLPLLGFAAGIELSQVLLIFGVLTLSELLVGMLKLSSAIFVGGGSLMVAVLTLPMLAETFPW